MDTSPTRPTGFAATTVRSALARAQCNPAVLLVGIICLIAASALVLTDLSVTGLAVNVSVAVALCVISAVYATLRPAPWIAESAGYSALWILFTTGGCIVTYLAAMSGFPLRDGLFLAGDAVLGFDWTAWTSWVQQTPVLRVILILSYYSLLLQIIFCVLSLAFLKPGVRNQELMVAAVVGLLITCLISSLLPALGPFALFPLPGTSPQMLLYVPHLEALRSPGPHRFSVADLQGIIVLPSYHTVLAVLFTWVHRGLRLTFIPVLALNILMLISVPSEGGHYMTDLLAGLVVAAVAILAAQLLVSTPNPQATRRPNVS